MKNKSIKHQQDILFQKKRQPLNLRDSHSIEPSANRGLATIRVPLLDCKPISLMYGMHTYMSVTC